MEPKGDRIRTNRIGVSVANRVFTQLKPLLLSLFVGVAITLAPQLTLKQSETTEGARPIVSTNSSQDGWHLQIKTASAATRSVTRTVALPPEEGADESAQAIVDRALSAVGSRYRWGGTTLSGFDCSGLVRFAYGNRADNLPRSSSSMRRSLGTASHLKPGDILFFGRRSATHVAIYIGDGKIVHAATPRSGVRVDSLHRMAATLGFLGNNRI